MSDQDTGNEHLNTLVGEGKKYADTENLAKGYANLETHIETIKQEKVALEEKLGLQEAKDNHLEKITEMLKESKQEPVKKDPEPDPKPDPDPEPKPKEQSKEISVSAQLNMQQFAKDSVAKYGNADTVGKHLQDYIGDDKGRQALVTKMMQADPSALLKILPEKDKSFNPTGSEGTPQNDGTVLPLTWEDCVKVKKEDPRKFNSASFVRKMMEARAYAKTKGVPFGAV